jgi:hypothetical protein
MEKTNQSKRRVKNSSSEYEVGIVGKVHNHLGELDTLEIIAIYRPTDDKIIGAHRYTAKLINSGIPAMWTKDMITTALDEAKICKPLFKINDVVRYKSNSGTVYQHDWIITSYLPSIKDYKYAVKCGPKVGFAWEYELIPGDKTYKETIFNIPQGTTWENTPQKKIAELEAEIARMKKEPVKEMMTLAQLHDTIKLEVNHIFEQTITRLENERDTSRELCRIRSEESKKLYAQKDSLDIKIGQLQNTTRRMRSVIDYIIGGLSE